ncbi:hypothetical protein J2T56_003249 [Natronobacillus azotifigens]|uniref:Uncharacterized protein n=1 Tax=Natronobacillus azotifigens TaxID=472978 RepID=A0A9J6RGT0_9BACI|nr:hypothetical protein [Natronobacillus azotifigens]MCZ0704645.1 hypothetical protein [Natronobacillus azotifigens]
MSNLSYLNLESELYKKIGNTSSIDDEKRKNELKEELKDWTIIKAQDSNFWSGGLGAIAVKKGHDIVIGYRGTKLDAFR